MSLVFSSACFSAFLLFILSRTTLFLVVSSVPSATEDLGDPSRSTVNLFVRELTVVVESFVRGLTVVVESFSLSTMVAAVDELDA